MHSRLRNLLFAMTATAVAGSAGVACSAKKNTELVVAVQTDLRIPKDLNAVTVKIVAMGGTYFDETFEVGPGGLHLPATIGIVPDDDKNLQPVDIQLIGRFDSDLAKPKELRNERVLRRARVTFAKDKVGLVRLPLRFTCYDVKCGDEETCIAGECHTIPRIEGVTLPDYTNDEVFGAGGTNPDSLGTCWNADACLASSVSLTKAGDCIWALTPAASGGDAGTDGGGTTLDAGADASAMMPPDASIPDGSAGDDAAGPPSDAGAFFKRFEQPGNVTVVLTNDKGLGFCNGGTCRVPLDFDEEEGWSWANDGHTLIKLAPSLCKKVTGAVRVEATDACATKTASTPFCEEAADAGAGDASTDTCTPSKPCSTGMCGPMSDGCGGMVDCGGCADPMVCDTVSHMCTSSGADSGPPCMPPSTMCMGVCTDIKSDPKNCGGCAIPCFGSCIDGFCMGAPDASAPDASCTPKTCADMGAECGMVGDGCGGVIACGTCSAPSTCGGGGIPNKCGASGADAGTCSPPRVMCGPTCADLTSDPMNCGMCFKSCGSGTTCVASSCVPADAGSDAATDTGVVDTGVPDTFVPDADGGSCTKKTCADYPGTCGPQSDGCGGILPSCGTCTIPDVCGGGGPSKCGTSVCTPKTCAMLGFICGMAADGCGGTISCGVCATGSCIDNVCK